jgi:hypothetical protein
VLIFRGLEACEADEAVVGDEEYGDADEGVEVDCGEAVAFERAEWARKAARKFERKGRFVGILADMDMMLELVR